MDATWPLKGCARHHSSSTSVMTAFMERRWVAAYTRSSAWSLSGSLKG